MPSYKKYFFHALQYNFPSEFSKIITETDNHYSIISNDISFASDSGNPLDKRLDVSSYFLAMIKTLDEKGENYETIRKICLEVVTDFVRPKNKFQQFLKRLPAKLANTWLANKVIKILHNRVSQNAHPDGFVANIITDIEKTYGLGYGFDIIECGIHKLFKKHNYGKYTPILCEVDFMTSNMAGLQLKRTGTIANGAKICDFRFKKEILKEQ